MSYSILFTNNSKLSVQQDAHFFSKVLDLDDYGARAYVSKNSSGIIISGIDQTAAVTLKNSLSQHGYPLLIVPDDTINQLSVKPVKIASIENTVFFEDIFGNGTHYEIGDITATAVSMNKQTEKNTAFEREYLLDLIFKDGVVLRFNSKKFNYGYLGERKSHAVIQNFNQLLNDIDKKLPEQTFKNEGYSLALLEQYGDIPAPENSKAWDQFILWLSHSYLFKSEPLDVSELNKVDDNTNLISLKSNIPICSQKEQPEETEYAALSALEEPIEEIIEEITEEPIEEIIIPFQNYSPKDLIKKIRAVLKAFEEEKSPEYIAAKMVAKGTLENDAFTITNILSDFKKNKSDDISKIQILTDYFVPEHLHKVFINNSKELNKNDLIEKIREKQGRSKEARRKSTIKNGRIAMIFIAMIILGNSLILWKGINNELNRANLNYEADKFIKQVADEILIVNAVIGTLFLFLAAFAGVSPVNSCRLGFLLISILTAYEIFLYRERILYNFWGHIFKVFVFSTLFYSLAAAKKQRNDST